MSAFTSESFLDQLIAIQRKAIQTYILFAIGLAIFGVAIITTTFFLPDENWLKAFPTAAEGVKGAFSWGGAFITSLMGLPVKEIVDRSGKIHIFRNIKFQMEDLKSAPAVKQAKAQKQLEELMWRYVEKAALG